MIDTKQPVWAVTPKKVKRAIKKIIAVSHPRKLILFGSYVNGDAGPGSDLDILVVTGDEVKHARKESVRIRRALRDILMAMDILVVPQARFKELKDAPGLIYREALRNGRVVYESTEP